MSKILTLVIPTYNMQDYLPECLDSLLIEDEFMSLLEILVIIDGATDNSAKIGQSYAERYPDTFRIILKENGNYGSCVNYGIAQAKGKYIKTLDADDRFETKHFAKFLKCLQVVDADMIINDYAGWNMTNGHIDYFKYNLPNPNIFTIEELKFTPQVPLMMHAAAYRTSLLRDMKYRQTEGISYTDQEWTFMPLTQVKTIWYFPQILYIYRVGRTGQTVDINVWIHHADEEIFGLKKMTKFYQDVKDKSSDTIRRILEYRLKFRVNAIYNHIFIRSFGAVDDTIIKDLDQYVHQNLPFAYNQLGKDITYHGLNVIDLYRKHPFVYKLYLQGRKIAKNTFKK